MPIESGGQRIRVVARDNTFQIVNRVIVKIDPYFKRCSFFKEDNACFFADVERVGRAVGGLIFINNFPEKAVAMWVGGECINFAKDFILA